MGVLSNFPKTSGYQGPPPTLIGTQHYRVLGSFARGNSFLMVCWAHRSSWCFRSPIFSGRWKCSFRFALCWGCNSFGVDAEHHRFCLGRSRKARSDLACEFATWRRGNHAQNTRAQNKAVDPKWKDASWRTAKERPLILGNTNLTKSFSSEDPSIQTCSPA